jgi:hypothetical protein
VDSITKLTLVVVTLQAATLIATIGTVVLFYFTLKEARATTREVTQTADEMTKAVDAISMLSESTHMGQLWQKWHSPEVNISRVFGQTFEKSPPENSEKALSRWQTGGSTIVGSERLQVPYFFEDAVSAPLKIGSIQDTTAIENFGELAVRYRKAFKPLIDAFRRWPKYGAPFTEFEAFAKKSETALRTDEKKG